MVSKLRLVAAAVAVAFASAAPMASATVLTFDDLGTGQGFFLSNYNGFQFGTNNIANTAWFHTDETSTFYKPHSGSVYISTDFQLYTAAPFAYTQPISNATPFKFDGAWFTGGENVHYQLLLGNSVVYTSADSAVLTASPTFVSSGYLGLVTSVLVYGHQGYYAMDDFTFNTPLPESETYAMMLAGLVGMGVVVRRRSKARGK